MAALTDAETAYLLSELGDDADLTDAQLRYDRLGSVHAVVLETLRQRLASLLDGPASFSVAGVYSENNGDIIRALQAQLARLETETFDEDELTGSSFAVKRHRLMTRRGR